MWPGSLPDIQDEHGDIIPNKETAEILWAFWENQLCSGLWANLKELARHKAHDKLAAAIADILPKQETFYLQQRSCDQDGTGRARA